MKQKFLLLFMLISGIAFSQITINHSDYEAAFALGSVYNSYSTPLDGGPISVFVGEASGTAQYWDFSTFNWEYVAKSWSVEPSTAPFISTFPDANIVLYEKSWILGTDTLYNWNYKELLSDKFLVLGLSDDASVLLTYDPPAVHATVPVTYGSSWMRERDSTYIMAGYWTITEGNVTGDAFGTMKLPSGEYECLRFRQDNRSIVHTPIGVDTTHTRNFGFYSKGVREVNIPTILEDQFNLTTVSVNGIKYSDREGGLGISDKKAESISLYQNYPNPVSNSTVISWQLAVGSYVVVKIIDVTGRVIKTLVDEYVAPGKHQVLLDVSDMPDGVYIYQIEANGMLLNKMIVVRK